ncbi:MAG: hypothetical protein BGP17_09750 [Sphingomonas sp. 67-41]|nr:MAG: hypothetical protein BGP17_09750 [Sphingomonas sp. 67-41]
MRSPFTLSAFIALILFGCKASAEPTRADAATARRIADSILAAQIEANGVPGMGAAVWRGGALVWSGSVGQADREAQRPVTADTVFRLASVSKLFAVTAAAKLREAGKLDTNAPIGPLLPWLPGRWPPITSAQLAAHISGLPHYQPVDDGRGGHAFKSVREAVGLFQDRALLSAPGTRYEYSTWGITLLSAVVEQAAHRPYLDYLAAQITPGLKIGADRTGADPNASVAYAFADDGRVVRAAPHDYSYSWGGAGLSATMPDLARWGGQILNGKVVSPATLDWMLTPAKLADGSDVREGRYAIGFGWRTLRDSDGQRIAYHAGIAEGARSALALYPTHGLAVSLGSNAIWVSAIEQTAQMLAAPFLAGPLPTGVSAVGCPAWVTGYRGSYAGQEISGSASFGLRDGLCTGTIALEPGNPFGAWLDSFPQRNASALALIGVEPKRGGRFALVTPIGVYDLRSPDGRHYSAALGGSRMLTLTLQ